MADRADRAAGRPGGRRARGPRRLQQLQDFQQTTRLPTDDKSPWALIVHKATTRRRIKKKVAEGHFFQRQEF